MGVAFFLCHAVGLYWFRIYIRLGSVRFHVYLFVQPARQDDQYDHVYAVGVLCHFLISVKKDRIGHGVLSPEKIILRDFLPSFYVGDAKPRRIGEDESIFFITNTAGNGIAGHEVGSVQVVFRDDRYSR